MFATFFVFCVSLLYYKHDVRPALAALHRIMQAGGNDALALLLTVTTNLLGVVTVPFFVQLVVKAGEDASIDAVELLVKLVREGGGRKGRVKTSRMCWRLSEQRISTWLRT